MYITYVQHVSSLVLTPCRLMGNKISDSGAYALSGALTVNQSLQELEWVLPFRCYMYIIESYSSCDSRAHPYTESLGFLCFHLHTGVKDYEYHTHSLKHRGNICSQENSALNAGNGDPIKQGVVSKSVQDETSDRDTIVPTEGFPQPSQGSSYQQ